MDWRETGSDPLAAHDPVVEDLTGTLAQVVRSALDGLPGSLDRLEIRLDRTACCFVPCPTYGITLHGDGSFVYEGRADVGVEGKEVGSVGPAGVLEILRTLEASGLLEGAPLQEMCFGPSNVSVILSSGGVERLLMTYPGAEPADPAREELREALWGVVRQIETATGARAWIE